MNPVEAAVPGPCTMQRYFDIAPLLRRSAREAFAPSM